MVCRWPLLTLALSACSPSVRFPATGSDWPAHAPLPFAGQPRFAVTDNLSDQLSFVSVDRPAPPTLLGNEPVGDVPLEIEAPHHIAASPDGRYLYYNLSNYTSVSTGVGPHGSHGNGTVPG